MRIVFMGTPDFAVPSLQALAQAHEVTLAVTRPDAVRGRGRRLMPSPVKEAAQELGIPVLETKRVSPEVLEAVRDQAPDLIAVAAFGAILPDDLLALAPLGCVNVHGSLLPRWRGAAPIQRAILAGDERIGISIMRIVHDLDAGSYCRQAWVERGQKGAPQIMADLARLGADELVRALADMEAGTAVWQDQDPSQVTYAEKVDKAEMRLNPAASARDNCRRVQASLDEAPARLSVGGRGIRALAARVSGEPLDQGAVLVRKGHVFLGCSEGSLELLTVKPDGKRQMEASAWASGLRGVTSWEAV